MGDLDAYERLEALLWTNGAVCPHCGNGERCYFLAPRDGVKRRTSSGATTSRRIWKCGACRRQFSVMTGTVMHGSKISADAWAMLIENVRAGKPIGNRATQRFYGLTGRSVTTALRRLHSSGLV